MMKFLTFFLLNLTILSTSFAEETNHCFNAIQKHINEAMAHNKSVAPIYKKLSDGKSSILSWGLISSEWMSLFFMKRLDHKAKTYQEKGIPLLCAELADMKSIPAFREHLPQEQRPTEFFQYDYSKANDQIKELLDSDQLDKAYAVVATDIKLLEKYPNQLCLTRHFLESMGRTLLLAPKNRSDAKKLGLPDPIEIIKDFVTDQRRALPFVYYGDKRAFPLQKEGFLLYCQDVPAIAWK